MKYVNQKSKSVASDAGAYQKNQSRDRAGKLGFSGGIKMNNKGFGVVEVILILIILIGILIILKPLF